MNWDYINDATDPRGVEYAATRRGARAARDTARNTADLLDIQLNGPAAVDRIRARRARQVTHRRWWTRVDLIASALFVVGVGGYMLAPSPVMNSNAHSGAVRGAPHVGVSKVPDASRAPVRLARAPAIKAAVDRAEARGDVDADNPDIVYLSDSDFDNVAKLDKR